MEIEKIAFVFSLQDAAGCLIKKKIEEIGKPEWVEFYEFEEDIVFVDVSKVREEKIVFLSRHQSETGTKSLTVHMTGNFSEAKFGGRAREVSKALPRIGANYLRGLFSRYSKEGLDKQGFVVSMEVTHHGPLVNKPCLFIELGSSPSDWKNEVAAKVIAQTILEDTWKENTDGVVIGLGGGHYAPDFTKLCLRQPYAFGHICPKHYLSELNVELIWKMIRQSNANGIVLDWKGLKENKEKIMKLCGITKLKTEKVQSLLK
jgi:D-aminoacyl-tRNA deacylase